MNTKMTKEHWEILYNSRVQRLKKLIELNAPKVIIDTEAKMLRAAIHQGRLRVLLHDIKVWFEYRWLKFEHRNDPLDGPPSQGDNPAS